MVSEHSLPFKIVTSTADQWENITLSIQVDGFSVSCTKSFLLN